MTSDFLVLDLESKFLIAHEFQVLTISMSRPKSEKESTAQKHIHRYSRQHELCEKGSTQNKGSTFT